MFKFLTYKRKYNGLVDEIKSLKKIEENTLSFLKSDTSGQCTVSQENVEVRIKVLKKLIRFINQ